MHRIVTGAEYVTRITALESDREARTAFQQLALALAPPGTALLDFGSGPGLDARFYAEHDRTVAAYDVDPAMCEFFAAHCHDLIAAGRITLQRGDYQHFLAGDAPSRAVDLVTTNFAPLNLIDDLHELFAKFHALVAPNGRVLASVLSPYFIGDLKYGWWWRNVLRMWRDGHFSVQGAQARIFRRGPGEFAAQSAPYFALTQIFPGPAFHKRAAHRFDRNTAVGNTWLRLTACRYMFLLFEKRDYRSSNGQPAGPGFITAD